MMNVTTGSCMSCSTGTVGVGGVCNTTCGAGTAANSNATACITCPDGSAPSADRSACAGEAGGLGEGWPMSNRLKQQVVFLWG